MPVANQYFGSESGLETSSSSNYHGVLAQLNLGVLALVVLVGARQGFKIFKKWREKPSKPYYYPAILSSDNGRFHWKAGKKSRGASIVRLERMSGVHTNMPAWKQTSADKPCIVAKFCESSEQKPTESRNQVERKPLHQPREGLTLPAPPPPLTLPQLSSTVFGFEDRRRSFPDGSAAEFETEEFMYQPNPDYVGDSSSIALEAAASISEEARPAATSRRRSYTKVIQVDSELSGSRPDFDCTPRSFPSNSSYLPPPADFAETSHVQHDIGVRGEIISSFDDAGHGWKRHTRVYGGGVCFACLQSGGEGGFYGKNVRPEDRR